MVLKSIPVEKRNSNSSRSHAKCNGQENERIWKLLFLQKNEYTISKVMRTEKYKLNVEGKKTTF